MVDFEGSHINDDDPNDVVNDMAELIASGIDENMITICYRTALQAAIDSGQAANEIEAFDVVDNRVQAFKEARHNGEA